MTVDPPTERVPPRKGSTHFGKWSCPVIVDTSRRRDNAPRGCHESPEASRVYGGAKGGGGGTRAADGEDVYQAARDLDLTETALPRKGSTHFGAPRKGSTHFGKPPRKGSTHFPHGKGLPTSASSASASPDGHRLPSRDLRGGLTAEAPLEPSRRWENSTRGAQFSSMHREEPAWKHLARRRLRWRPMRSRGQPAAVSRPASGKAALAGKRLAGSGRGDHRGGAAAPPLDRQPRTASTPRAA